MEDIAFVSQAKVACGQYPQIVPCEKRLQCARAVGEAEGYKAPEEAPLLPPGVQHTSDRAAPPLADIPDGAKGSRT